MTKLYFVRHGFSPANNAGYNGQKGVREFCAYDEYMPLDDYGKMQSVEVGEYLSGEVGGEKVLLLVGPYYRTRQTAQIILNCMPEQTLKNFDVAVVDSLREINQGLEYAEPVPNSEELDSLTDLQLEMLLSRQVREEYAKNGNDPESLPYLSGESLQEVSQRLRHFSKDLKDVVEFGNYDSVIVVTHNSVIKALYRLLTDKIMTQKLYTGSALKIEDLSSEPEKMQSFVPKTDVPHGYTEDFSKFKNYSRLLNLKLLIDEHKSSRDFNRFWGDQKTEMPLEDECAFIEKEGECLVILPGNTKKKGYFYIEAPVGQDRITHDRRSKSTYYVLGGKGKFYVKSVGSGDFEVKEVKAGDIAEIEPNTVFYYESCGDPNRPEEHLRLIEKMEPNFSQENIVDHGPTPYFTSKQKGE